jgi:DNA-binding XRE family transcriptional regulator
MPARHCHWQSTEVPREEEEHMHFGQYIRGLRVAQGITLRDFARQLDVSPTYISQIEQGHFAPPAEERVVLMAQILGEDVDELLARAGRVADDLPHIIRQQPRAIAHFLRTAKGLSAEDIERLVTQAEQLKQQQKDPS